MMADLVSNGHCPSPPKNIVETHTRAMANDARGQGLNNVSGIMCSQQYIKWRLRLRKFLR